MNVDAFFFFFLMQKCNNKTNKHKDKQLTKMCSVERNERLERFAFTNFLSDTRALKHCIGTNGTTASLVLTRGMKLLCAPQPRLYYTTGLIWATFFQVGTLFQMINVCREVATQLIDSCKVVHSCS